MSRKYTRKRSGTGLDHDKTDWDKIAKLSDREIDNQIAKNPDAAPAINWDEVNFVKVSPKKAISIRLDPDVIEFFKAKGKGYQSRINEVLRSFMEHETNK